MPDVFGTPDTDALFPADYLSAREGFLAAATAAGAELDRYAHPEAGMQGEALSTDTAWIGPRDASRVLVLVSATHGVEGFSGSACQVDWLTGGGPEALPEGTAALLVHAINPWGFSWLRRTTQENVDLNRNGLDFDQPLPENPGYAELGADFSPPAIEGPEFEAAQARLEAWRLSHGDEAYNIARQAGQYIDPNGTYYGGTGPTWSAQTIAAICEDNDLSSRTQVAIIDYHTGLGPYGYGEPICGCRPEDPGRDLMRGWYGPSMTEPLLGTSSSVVIPGLSQYLWKRCIGVERFAFIALEYGTLRRPEMELAMRRENWLHAHGDPLDGTEATAAIKAGMRAAYDPQRADWREMVLSRSRQVQRQTMTGLSRIA